MSLKIFAPIKLKPTGGTSRFAQNFQSTAHRLGHQVFFDYQPNYNALLIIVSCPLRYLLEAKIKRRPIIHRLDGVYYPATIAGYRYPFYNLKPQLIHHYFVNYTIYQSQYSQYCCDHWLKPTRHPSSIIYNGVDTKHFTPTGPRQTLRDNPDQHIFITWSRFRRPDQILPILRSFKIYQDTYHANSKLLVLGSFEPPLGLSPKTALARWRMKPPPNVQFIGPVDSATLPSYARASDLFLITHQNPPCPNNVLEAMACGLPICGVADGAMTELTKPGFNSELIPASGDAFHHPRQLDTEGIAANMNKIMLNQTHYQQHSRLLALERFQLQNMTNQYLSIFDTLVHT